MDIPEPFVEPTQRRIRVRLGNELVAESTRAQLLVQYGPGALPTYYLPREDVVPGALIDEVPGTGAGAGAGSRWTVQAGRKRAERAAWSNGEPTGEFAALADHVTFSWRQLDWYEEDEQVFVHARDPYKRVDTLHSSRRVQVFIGGEEIANSIRPLLLFETHLPTRYYVPFEDVRTELLEPSTKTTTCPYKGRARYWSVRAGGQLERDIVWSYAEPIRENPKIRGLLSFYNERVDLVVDGERLERPVTPFS
ncbi:DUF427 domain-containing protein [Crystallibacter degradans]|uniref:DUF427 domain-containing protein n=1 Tax=Crystallibacter degradans TaxID=2726743 RepID=UPI001473B176|nr:DUF427 domain-containing protein [Arthrobacter sp. SF27]NMR30561.1 DUF427 domain-containing protein [Arthrobacter sp. SF27]